MRRNQKQLANPPVAAATSALLHNYFVPHIILINADVTPASLNMANFPPSTYSAILDAGARADATQALPRIIRYVYIGNISDPTIVANVIGPRIFVLNEQTNPLAVPGIPEGSTIQLDNASPEVIAALANKNYTITLGGNLSATAIGCLGDFHKIVTLGPQLSRAAIKALPHTVVAANVTNETEASAIDEITKRPISLQIHSTNLSIMQAIRPGTSITLHGCCGGISVADVRAIPANCPVRIENNLPDELVTNFPDHVTDVTFGIRANATSVSALRNVVNVKLMPGANFALVAEFFDNFVLATKDREKIKDFLLSHVGADREPKFRTDFAAQFRQRIRDLAPAPVVNTTAAASPVTQSTEEAPKLPKLRPGN